MMLPSSFSPPRGTALALLLLALPFTAPHAQQPTLLKDINPKTIPHGSNPKPMARLGSIGLFLAYRPDVGTELWRTDGTQRGTYLIKDITPGIEGSWIPSMTVMGQHAYFVVHTIIFLGTQVYLGSELWRTDGTALGTQVVTKVRSSLSMYLERQHIAAFKGRLYLAFTTKNVGNELFVSDGTAKGTKLLKDLWPGAEGSAPADFQVLGNKLFFTATNASMGRELWVSDGTANGTRPVADLNPGRWNSNPNQLTLHRGKLYFRTMVGSDVGLWITDGTAKGTRRIKGSGNDQNPVRPDLLTSFGNRLWFKAWHRTKGLELWSTDGTAKGLQCFDLEPGGSSFPSELTVLGNKLFFHAWHPKLGRELWISDGTYAGTKVLKDINPKGQGNPFSLTAAMGKLFFCADDSVHGREPWVSDGTAKGTKRLADIWPGPSGQKQCHFFDCGTFVLFAGDNGVMGREPFVTDGTAKGTHLLANINAASLPYGSNPASWTKFGDRAVFLSQDRSGNKKIWISDGTNKGTLLLSKPGPQLTVGEDPMAIGNQIYFRAYDWTSGMEPWISDGTPLGTRKLADIFPGSRGSNPQGFVRAGNKVFFVAEGKRLGTELWVTDGTTAGTKLVTDLRPGSLSSQPRFLIALGNRVVFSADDGVSGTEIHVSDGSPAGTQRLKDINVGIGSSSPYGLTLLPRASKGLSDLILFIADDGVRGRELYVTDGSPAGTKRLKDINPGSPSSDLRELTLFQGRIWFQANDGKHGAELWVSDGTPKGTQLYADLWPGPSSSKPTGFAASQGMALDRLYFRADNGKSGWELFSTAGTAGSTGLLKDIHTGQPGSNPKGFTQWQGRMWFTAHTQAQGLEIWSTDGTTVGTRILLDINPGPASGVGKYAPWTRIPILVPSGERRAWFMGRSSAHGAEIWVTDGSAKGTKMVFDLVPGPMGSEAKPSLVASGRLFLSAKSPQFGLEPFVLDPGASAYSIGEANGPMQLRLSGSEAILGGKSRLQLRNIKARSTVALVFGAAATRPRSIMPGTLSYVDPATLDVLAGYASTGSSLQISLQVPNDLRLLGARLAIQAYAMRGMGQPISSSNAVVLKAGR